MDLETISTMARNLASEDYNPVLIGFLSAAVIVEIEDVFSLAYFAGRYAYRGLAGRDEEIPEPDSRGGYSI